VTIMPVVGLVLDVSRIDSNTAGLFFWSLVDFGIVSELGTTLASKDLGDCSSQSGFTVIDVTSAGGQSETITECLT
jgi:hypothetical protein